VPDFYERMEQAAAARRAGVSTPTTVPSRRKKGTLFKILDYIDRPRMTVSEAVQAALAGEDVGEAAWRGITGRPEYGTLGEAAFPAAAEPGFQPEDIPAFAINILTDPTIWIGPGAVKAVGKPIAKGALALGARAIPKEAARLKSLTGAFGEAVRGLPREAKVKMINAELRELGMDAEQAFGRVWKLTTPENRAKLRAFTDPSGVVKKVSEIPDEGLTIFQEAIRDLQANVRPDTFTSLNSLMQAAAQRWAPAGAFLRTFNGSIGRRYSELYKSALHNTEKRLAEATSSATKRPTNFIARLKELQKLPGAKNESLRELTTDVVERFKPPPNAQVATMANEVERFLKDFADEIIDPKHYDEFGNGLMIWDDAAGIERPLVEMLMEEGYFPRRLPAEAFSSKGQKMLRKKLEKRGIPSDKITEQISRLRSVQPKKVGHVEYARTGQLETYEKDFLKVLPKYVHDIVWRQELGKQFGMNNQVLDAISEELITRGVSENWVRRLGTAIIGRNPYYDKIETLMRKLGTYQAISKLGFSTSVANLSQATNQGLRSSFGNLAQSSAKYIGEKAGMVEKTNYDMLSLSRRAWGDILATAGHEPTGMIGWMGDMYMRGIGFPLTERIGRHIGAIGGDLEVQALAKAIRNKPWYVRAKDWPKERGRLLSEIGRKYGVTEKMITATGELPKDIITRSAWDAARKTMHAFDVMELPLAWQDPTWKMILQFKSFIYKQSEFMFNEVAMPGIQWLATNGAKGDIRPLLRAMIVTPGMAELVSHGRDITKSLPTRIVETAKNYVTGQPLSKTKWDYKDPFWEDPDPSLRILSDSIYMGLFGIVGDMYEASRRGRLLDWLAGPTIGDIVDVGQTVARGGEGLGKVATQAIPGALGVPYGADIFKSGESFYNRMMREVARRKLQ